MILNDNLFIWNSGSGPGCLKRDISISWVLFHVCIYYVLNILYLNIKIHLLIQGKSRKIRNSALNKMRYSSENNCFLLAYNAQREGENIRWKVPVLRNSRFFFSLFHWIHLAEYHKNVMGMSQNICHLGNRSISDRN